MQDKNNFRVNIGDIELAVTEWEGSGYPVLLLHATGFHSQCWNEVVKQLPGRHVYAVDLRFHGQSGDTGEVKWGLMAEDILQLVEMLDLERIVVVGHSLGGYLAARVAAGAPHRLKHLLLIDPVIRSPERTASVRALTSGWQPSDHPVSRRKNQWVDAQEMFHRFKDRAPFDTWQPEVLRDYCNHALKPANEEAYRRLACDPLHEASIYLNHDDIESILPELPKIVAPTTLLRAPAGDGGPSNSGNSPTWPELATVLPNCEEVYLPELNHFIPMQNPVLVAEHILAVSQ